jgi:hypothetical protein
MSADTRVWTKVETIGQPPAVRSRHAVALYAHRMLIFGGSDRTNFYNDLHVYDFGIYSSILFPKEL